MAEKSPSGYYGCMKYEKMLTRAFNSMIVIIVASILAAAVFLIYRTFEKSTEAEIFRYSRELEESVRRASSVEFRRYMLLMELGKSIGVSSSDEDFPGLLEQRSFMLREEGELPHLVSSIGYFLKESPENAIEYDFESGEWLQLSGDFEPKESGRGWIFSTDKGLDRESFYFAVENSGGDRVVFFRLDSAGFIDNYIKEIIESANEEFDIQWLRNSNEAEHKYIEEYFDTEPDRYRFRPIRILAGLEDNAQPLLIDIPGIFDINKFISRMDNASNDESDIKPVKARFSGT